MWLNTDVHNTWQIETTYKTSWSCVVFRHAAVGAAAYCAVWLSVPAASQCLCLLCCGCGRISDIAARSWGIWSKMDTSRPAQLLNLGIAASIMLSGPPSHPFPAAHLTCCPQMSSKDDLWQYMGFGVPFGVCFSLPLHANMTRAQKRAQGNRHGIKIE